MILNQNDTPIVKSLIVSHCNDLTGEWISALGQIACYFAQLEGLSYTLIERFEEPAKIKESMEEGFTPRTERAKKLVKNYFRKTGSNDLKNEWVNFLNRAKKTARDRNLVLHNPLSVNLMGIDALTCKDTGIDLIKMEGRPRIKLGKVQEFSDKLRHLNIEMNDLLNRSNFGTS